MTLSEFSLRRPIFAIVLNIIIVLFGAIGYKYLGIRDYPAIDSPNINVRTSYPGANAEIIETQITEPLEKAVNGIPGIRNITSQSSMGSSSITVEFELGSDLEASANDVRDKVSQAQRQLPTDLLMPPVVSKADNSGDPIIIMLLKSDKRNSLQLSEFANNNIVERLQTVNGVSGVNVWGEKRYAMRIWFDPAKMSAYSLSPNDVQAALLRENIELPAGKISGNATELGIRTFGKISTEKEFNDLIVKNIGGRDIRVSDIGAAVLGPENEESILKESNVPMIALAVTPQPGTNYVSISDEVKKRLAEIIKTLPDDVTLEVTWDQTDNIRKSINEVEETLLIAFVLVVLIIFLFFRDWLIAIRPLIDIPVSLIGAFFIMYLTGFTINVLTLLAIVLATGLVVDDGIVVTENIYKKMEGGMDKWKAAKEGSKEIYFAVIATSITLAVVFLPIIFLQGFTGRLFREFGIVVAGAVLISAFVSLTLTPVLNVYLSKKTHSHSWFYIKTEPFFTGMENGYRRLLNTFMRVRYMAWVIMAACFAIIFFLGKTLKSELAPLEDKSGFRLAVSAPEGTSYDAMDKYMDKLTNFFIDSLPEKRYVTSMTAPGFISGGANSGFIRIALVEPSERKKSQQEIVAWVNKNMPRFNDGRAFAIQEQTIQVNRRSGQPVQFVIQNTDNEKLKQALPRMLQAVNNSKILQNADADLKFNKPELRISIDRMKASELGVSVQNISQVLQMALSNQQMGYFTKDGKQYSVIGQVERINRDDPNDLKKLYVTNSKGQSISLNNLVTIAEDVTPPTLFHFNRYRSATLSAGLEDGMTVGDGIKEIQAIADTVLDESFHTSLAGASRDYAESSGNTYFAFFLALVLIFLVLAAQFESFVDPFTIMFTVPLALAGAVISLSIFGQTLNIFSQIGMIMLIGLVTKNGILIVEFANQKQLQGIKKFQAVKEAAVARFRPILMTSLAMSLGALPLALSLGDAATSRIPLGIVIVGGVMFSLVLTLFVIPAIYSFLSTVKHKSKLDEMNNKPAASA
ncbi:MAG: efflux RND transporter permease subunit [Chitinophagaceae bacterium]|nr:efflux RND transporter permease subunit [Chitinophagaceae bacterium]MBP6046797.1 efflux RND transporter permease subunit [Ferruginibacter sp.]MBK8928257.1 efflux RND transporter permease subunit [Chitinophagaceae bacterium]MBP6371422.1 efflux RND transporter permease subunit [Ferruginibacter sp.]MBP6988972.1 efflux RND transporter permease subunit [Ferruginibacter sp.]